jgi:hypothetical protein
MANMFQSCLNHLADGLSETALDATTPRIKEHSALHSIIPLKVLRFLLFILKSILDTKSFLTPSTQPIIDSPFSSIHNKTWRSQPLHAPIGRSSTSYRSTTALASSLSGSTAPSQDQTPSLYSPPMRSQALQRTRLRIRDRGSFLSSAGFEILISSYRSVKLNLFQLDSSQTSYWTCGNRT